MTEDLFLFTSESDTLKGKAPFSAPATNSNSLPSTFNLAPTNYSSKKELHEKREKKKHNPASSIEKGTIRMPIGL